MSQRTSLVLNLSTLQLVGPLARVDVTDADSQLLSALALAVGMRMDASALLQQVGLPASNSGKSALGVRVVRLRKKLLAAGALDPTIKSIRSNGYQLCIPLVVHARENGVSQPFQVSPQHD